MKRGLYLLVGWAFILLGIFIAIAQLFALVTGGRDSSFVNLCMMFFNGCPASMGWNSIYLVLALGFVGSLILILLILFSGTWYLRIKKMTRLTNWSVGLNLIGICLVVFAVLFFLIGCSLGNDSSGECFAWSFGILGVPFALAPAGILYIISIILLLINWIKNK